MAASRSTGHGNRSEMHLEDKYSLDVFERDADVAEICIEAEKLEDALLEEVDRDWMEETTPQLQQAFKNDLVGSFPQTDGHDFALWSLRRCVLTLYKSLPPKAVKTSKLAKNNKLVELFLPLITRIQDLIFKYYRYHVYGAQSSDIQFCDDLITSYLGTMMACAGINLNIVHPGYARELFDNREGLLEIIFVPDLMHTEALNLVREEQLFIDSVGNGNAQIEDLSLARQEYESRRGKLRSDMSYHAIAWFKSSFWAVKILIELGRSLDPQRTSPNDFTDIGIFSVQSLANSIVTPYVIDMRGWPVLYNLGLALTRLEFPEAMSWLKLGMGLVHMLRIHCPVVQLGDPATSMLYGLARPETRRYLRVAFRLITENFKNPRFAEELFVHDTTVRNNAAFALVKLLENITREQWEGVDLYFIAHACRIYGLPFVTYARNISTWRSILFPYLHSRLTRHAGNKAYTTYEKLVQLIEKSRGLTDGNVRRYEYQLVRSPLEAETDLDEFYPSCDFGDCPSRFESHKQPKLCSRCLDAIYCSVRCQSADWLGHKAMCAQYTSLPEESSILGLEPDSDEESVMLKPYWFSV